MQGVFGRVKGGVTGTGACGVVREGRRDKGQGSRETVGDRMMANSGPAKSRDTVAEGSAIA